MPSRRFSVGELGTYYNEALGVTESVGGTSVGDSAARAGESSRILRFIGATRARPGV